MFLNLLTQFTGALYLSQYSSTVYDELGFENVNILTLYLGVVTLFAACSGVVLLQFFDLRDLLVYGSFT